MKNKILKLIVVIVIAVMAVFNWGLVSKNSDLSDVSLANVEALAQEAATVRTDKYVKLTLDCFDKNGNKKGTYTSCSSNGSADCSSTKC